MTSNAKTTVPAPPEPVKKDSSATIEKGGTTSSQDSGKINYEFPPEAVESLTKLSEDFDTFEDARVADLDKINERFIKTSEMRISFHDKLMLLCGGSFALSLTFLSSLHRASSQPLKSMKAVEWAWVLLLVSIVFSWLHNIARSAAVEQYAIVNSTVVGGRLIRRLSKLLGLAGSVFGKAIETPKVGLSGTFTKLAEMLVGEVKSIYERTGKHTDASNRMSKIAGACGALAVLAVLVSFTLLIVFAIKNATLL